MLEYISKIIVLYGLHIGRWPQSGHWSTVEAEVVHLDTYRRVTGRKNPVATDQVVPIFSWRNNYQIRLLTRSAVVRACVTDTLEQLNVNTADPTLLTRGRRVHIPVNERRMNSEGLSVDDLLVDMRRIIQKITTYMPDPSFIRPESVDDSPYISIYIP